MLFVDSIGLLPWKHICSDSMLELDLPQLSPLDPHLSQLLHGGVTVELEPPQHQGAAVQRGPDAHQRL